MNRYHVTVEREVTERITFTVDGRTKQDAAMMWASASPHYR